MHTINEFFDIVVCLTVRERYDRQQWFQDQADDIGLRFEWFYALERDEPKISFCDSQIEILRQYSKYNRILVLEDDCLFKCMDNFQQCANELPNDWDMWYLGGNVERAKRYSPNLRRLRKALTTHAIGYTGQAAERIVKEYEYKDGQLYDTWLTLNTPKWKVFISSPMLAIQRPNYSDLWQRDVDYLDIWEDSDNYLARL